MQETALASVQLAHTGVGLASLAIRDKRGQIILELTYVTDAPAKIALEQIASALALTMDEATVAANSDAPSKPARSASKPFVVRSK